MLVVVQQVPTKPIIEGRKNGTCINAIDAANPVKGTVSVEYSVKSLIKAPLGLTKNPSTNGSLRGCI